jgi:ABC-2 type transport system ATP-binding protein
MTVDSYLDFVARIKGVGSGDRKKRIGEVKEKVSIQEYSNTLIKNLSKGYKQRAGLAQALVHDPEVLILDEPTVGLDPNQIIEVRELIKSLSGNHTIILSTHILPEVSMTCQRVVIIAQGKIAAVGTPENLTRQLQGSDRIYLEATGPNKALQARSEIDGIAGGTHKLDGSDAFSYNVETELKKDVRGRLARKIVESGFDLRWNQQHESEEVFCN